MSGKTLPLVTFALLSYNQEHCIGRAVAAALSQTYSPLEIILSDDCSSDRSFEIMQRAAAEYRGPHRIVLNRNPRNLNTGAHIDVVGKLAKGELIVKADGDDISLPRRVEVMAQRWMELGCKPVALYSACQLMDANANIVEPRIDAPSKVNNDKVTIARGDSDFLGASSAVSRSVFEAFPPIQRNVVFEDRVLPFRALLLGGVVSYIDEKLVQYCVEGGVSAQTYRPVHELADAFLADAQQRLMDLVAVEPDNLQLQKICLATIAQHKFRMALPFLKGARIEQAACDALRKGVGADLVLKLYLKYRLPLIYRLYVRRYPDAIPRIMQSGLAVAQKPDYASYGKDRGA